MVPSRITEIGTDCGRRGMERISVYKDHLSVSVHREICAGDWDCVSRWWRIAR